MYQVLLCLTALFLIVHTSGASRSQNLEGRLQTSGGSGAGQITCQLGDACTGDEDDVRGRNICARGLNCNSGFCKSSNKTEVITNLVCNELLLDLSEAYHCNYEEVINNSLNCSGIISFDESTLSPCINSNSISLLQDYVSENQIVNLTKYVSLVSYCSLNYSLFDISYINNTAAISQYVATILVVYSDNSIGDTDSDNGNVFANLYTLSCSN